jgi:hypothetical protein
MAQTTSDLFKRFSDCEGNLPLQTCDSYMLTGSDLVERTFLFIPNVQYFMQGKSVNRQFKKCPYRNNRFMQNFCYKLGVVATKLATVESGIL